MGSRERHSDNPAFLLLKALITGQKIFYATGDGNVNKKTIVCTDFTSIADQDGNQIHIVDPNSSAHDQTRDIEGATTAGTITVATAFDVQITEDTAFIISGIRSTPVEVANLETWIKTAIGDSSAHTLTSLVTKWGDIARSLDIILGARWDAAGDLGTDIANIITAISGIQNNTRFTAAVPTWMCKPDAGNEAFRVSSNLYDTEGNMEDPENSEILVRIIKDDGTYITATLYKDNAFVAVLDNPTDGTTFPAASGWRAMEREAAGKFFFFNKVAHDATEESLTVEFGWTEGTKTNYQSRSTEIADVHGDLGAILADTHELQTDWTNGGRLDLILDIIAADTIYIADGALPASPVANSLACFIASGGTALGTPLPASKSLYNIVGTGYVHDAGNFTHSIRRHLRRGLAGANATDVLAEADSLYGGMIGNINAVNRAAGKQQIAKTTEDLNQVIGTYDLFTGTTQDVLLESLLIRMPNLVAGGALTSISIQTDDATPQVLLSAADGIVANLTAEAQLAWQNFNAPVLIKAGTKVQLIIAGGAHGVAYVCDVVAKVRAVTSGGYLA